MRILHVLDHGLPLHSGYAFRTRAIMRAQLAGGWAAEAVTGPRQGEVGVAAETIDGLTFHRSKGQAPRGASGEAAGLARFAAAIDRAVRRFRPDVLHAHSPALSALAALPVARARGLPLVYEIRAFWEDAAVGNGEGTENALRYRATRALEEWVARRADGLVTICEGLRGDLVRRGLDPAIIAVVPNAVEADLLAPAPPRDEGLARTLGLANAEVIGFVGSFYPYEGLDDLIAAMPALVAARPAARLLLVGGGPAEAALRAQAAASPAKAHIRFAGRVPHGEVDRYYALADILAYPRRAMRLTELVTPLKPLEAMAQGRLVAASDIGGHRELIRDGDTGTLFPPGDPAALAAALAGLLVDRAGWPARRAAAHRFVAADRNWSSNIRRYQPVYQALVRARETSRAWPRPFAYPI